MAQPLLRSSAVFRRAIEACAEAVRAHGLDLLAEFEAVGGWSQPALATVGLVAVQARQHLALGPSLQTGLTWHQNKLRFVTPGMHCTVLLQRMPALSGRRHAPLSFTSASLTSRAPL